MGERRGEGGGRRRNATRSEMRPGASILFQDLARNGGVSGLVKQWESADSTVEDMIGKVSRSEAWGAGHRGSLPKV